MKLIYKGKYKNEDQLPKSVLPPNAVMFKEPETPAKLNIAASLFIIPAFILIAICMLCSVLLHGGLFLSIRGSSIIGLALSLLCLFPHEYLHAVCFGKDAEVDLYISPKDLMLFVYSNQPISKVRFIFLSLLPNLVFGWIPLIIWTVLPYFGMFSDVLFMFSIFAIMFGVGDYLNVFNALRQMPKGSMQQLSGFHSYWYMP